MVTTIAPPLVVIVGETASGKSRLAIDLAQKFNGEIICADSRTVYGGMNIGTAKPSLADQRLVQHHLLDISTPDRPITVATFQKLAKKAIEQIAHRQKLAIMVGGTGLYIDAVIFSYDFPPASDVNRRQVLSQLSIDELQSQLLSKGIELPENARNPRHLIRALEKGDSIAKRHALRPGTLVLGLTIDQAELKRRVTQRLEAMFDQGLASEVRRLTQTYGWDYEALKAIGYREFRDYWNGSQNLAETKTAIIHDTLLFAKRQRTWFKRNNSIHWLNKQGEAVDLVTTLLNKYYKGYE